MRNISTAFKTTIYDEQSKWFSARLLDWYHANKRHLPWRETKDPFKVWMSEIILQQTRVNQGLPYYLAFTETFETIEHFANADLDEILKLWQGLGYYSRARNMHHCARSVMEEYNGNFPESYEELQKLKGIGKYTAAAISSICFAEPVPTVDGNVFRVLSRVFGIVEDIAASASFKTFFEKAKSLMPNTDPGDFNQAMMEFGATVCTPKSPDCLDCIFSKNCFAYGKRLVADLPVKTKNIKVKSRYFHYHVYTYNHQLLIRKRDKGDIWTGLFEFDLFETEKRTKNGNFENAKHLYSTAEISHQLTHQKLHIRFHVYELNNEKSYQRLAKVKKMESVAVDSVAEYAVPKPIELFLKQVFCK